MANRTVKASVTGETIKLSNRTAGAAGSFNAVSLVLSFDSAWDGTTKKVYFFDANGENAVYVLLTTNLYDAATATYAVPIPAEPLALAGEMTVTIRGVEPDGDTAERIIMSASTTMKVLTAMVPEDDVSPIEPTPTQAEQLQSEIDEILSTITDAAESAASADASAAAAGTSATAAAASASAASGSATSAAGSAATATSAKDTAVSAKTDAESARDDAEAARDAAQTAQTGAETARSTAQTAATTALSAKTAAETAQGKAETARDDAQSANTTAQAAKTAAQTAKTGAETARDAAAASATAAASSKDSAASSATAASGSADAAASSATSASGSASTASTAATTATAAKAASETARDAAQTAQGSAENARDAAASSASSAASSATDAATSKTAAQTAQTAAETARTGAESAETNAEGHSEDAEAWAVGQRGGSDVGPEDPAYHNNSLWYKDQAEAIVGNDFLTKTGDGSNLTAAFTEASTLAAPVSGEKLSVLWGKVKKLFSSLGTAAYQASSSFAAAVHTHTASEVTDFSSAVAGNTAVSANTAARHTHSNKTTLDAITAAYTTAEKTKLSGIATGAQVNTVTSVAGRTGAVTLAASDVSGLADVATSGAYADLSGVPTALSAFTADSTHRLVTDTEKSTWNAKQAAITATGVLKGDGAGTLSAAESDDLPLDDTAAGALGLSGDPTVSDALALIPRCAPWTLLQSYTAAGTYTWTAPDVYGDGRAYDIGAFIIGGGGSGGARKNYSDNSATATGGGSGYTRTVWMACSPGVDYPVVVGAGGAAAVVASGSSAGGTSGVAGGSSSFAGNTASGGEGGKTGTTEANGASGGQSSDQRSSTRGGTEAPSMGRMPHMSISSDCPTVDIVPTMCINPFDGRKYLAAGGGCGGYNASVKIDFAPTLEDGTAGSAAAAVNTSTNVAATKGTAYGCGGGGAVSQTEAASKTNTVTSAPGADGAVLIYVRSVSA